MSDYKYLVSKTYELSNNDLSELYLHIRGLMVKRRDELEQSLNDLD